MARFAVKKIHPDLESDVFSFDNSHYGDCCGDLYWISTKKCVEEVMSSIYEYVRTRGTKPAQILLGWRIWLQLGYELDGTTLGVTEFYDIPVAVDEHRPDIVQMIPKHDRVRFLNC